MNQSLGPGIRSSRLERRKRIRSRNKKILLIFVVIFFGWIFFDLAKNVIVKHMIKYGTAEVGILEEKVPAKAVVIREERVVTAQAAGTFMPQVAEWEKVGVGQIIGYLATEKSTASGDKVKIAVKAPVPGLVSYSPDGLEGVLTADLLSDLDTERLSLLLEKNQGSVAPVTQVESGKPVVKIVDNLVYPYLYIKLPPNSLKDLPKKDDSFTVSFSQQIKRRTIVADIKTDTSGIYLILEIIDFEDLDLKTRFVSLDIVPLSFQGIILPVEALVQKESQDGVIIPKKGIAKWTEVEVKGVINDQAVVDGLHVGDQYILNPSLVKEGQRIL
jgi:putative membrane fusion protein